MMEPDTQNKKYEAYYWAELLGRPAVSVMKTLVEKFGALENAFNIASCASDDKNILENDDGILTGTVRERFYSKEKINAAISAVTRANEKHISMITCDSPLYPEALLTTDDYPLILFAEGNLEYLNSERKYLGVVGSRKCTAYGRNAVKTIVGDLRSYNIAVVSGMAKGIDAAGQYAALESGLPTIAVLGCGTDVVYPEENRGLYNKIKDSGLIISEYPPGEEPRKQHFPARNRIIAGMCSAVLVCDAGFGSGAIITAEKAVDIGRDVLAIPGNIDVASSAGVNDLIKKGAGLTTSYHDVLMALGIDDNGFGAGNADISALNDAQRAVYSTIKGLPSDRDEIIRRTGLDALTVGRVLTTLSILGFIKRRDDGLFEA